MTFPCFVRNGLLSLPGNTKEMIRQMKDGIYILDLKKEKSKATASMFAYLYGYVYPAILEEMGEFKSKENVDRLDDTLKERFGVYEVVTKYKLRIHKNHLPEKPFVKKTEVTAPKPKDKYTVQEMQDYWIALQKFAAEFFNLTLKDPDPDWKEKWGSSNHKKETVE